MELQQQQHSYVQKVGKEFVSNGVTSHNTTGTRIKEFSVRKQILPAEARQILLPIFNALMIDQGTGNGQRLGSAIYIHRIEVSYTMKEDPYNVIGPDENTVANRGIFPILSDPRMRILIVTPKNQYRFAPTSGTDVIPLYPYFNTASGGTFPEPVSVPVGVSLAQDYGMQLLPDPNYYNVEYDDIRNLKQQPGCGLDSGSFSFLIRRRFDYDQADYTANARIRMNDNMMQEMIPQIWLLLPNQLTGNDFTEITDTRYVFSCGVRIVYDNAM